MMNKLNTFFNPKSIALIGASSKKHKLGNDLFKNILINKKVKIYPINPNTKKINNIKCYPTVLDVKSNIDLAVIAIKSVYVPSVLEECGKKNIQNVIIISAGFKEIGGDGINLENQIINIAQKYNMNVLGPNCLGFIDTYSNINTTFALVRPKKGNIAFLSQSGAICTATLDFLSTYDIGVSKMISLGNKSVLNENHFLQYLNEDKNTKVIIMYLEEISNGKEFINTVSKIKKPIVVLKAGKSNRGKSAISLHTGSIATDDRIFDAVCEKYGIINVNNLDDIFNLCRMFDANMYKPINDVIILTNAGGPSVIATDLIDNSRYLNIRELEMDIQMQLKKVLPESASTHNPIDLIGDATSKRYEDALKIITKNNKDKIILGIVTPQSMTDSLNIAKVMLKYNKNKNIIPVFIGGKSLSKAIKYLSDKKAIVFDFLGNAISSINYLASMGKKIKYLNNTKNVLKQNNKDTDFKLLDVISTKNLLSKYNLNHIDTYVLNNIKDVDNININYPIVLKINDTSMIHKSDNNAVFLNIQNKDELFSIWNKVGIEKSILIQPMLKGIEIIVGIKYDESFGYVMIFGIGGIFVEVIQDISIGILPINDEDAIKMIKSIKSFDILNGARGVDIINIDDLKNILVNTSKLVLENKDILGIDFNPIIANKNGIYIVDAKIMKKEE